MNLTCGWAREPDRSRSMQFEVCLQLVHVTSVGLIHTVYGRVCATPVDGCGSVLITALYIKLKVQVRVRYSE